jgi:uncharacterized protein YjbJ (UPF0337 family)
MNWDISIGRYKQVYGRVLQAVGKRFSQRRMILNGEALEYAGRLQMRYGILKHQVQWNNDALYMKREPIPVKKSLSL